MNLFNYSILLKLRKLGSEKENIEPYGIFHQTIFRTARPLREQFFSGAVEAVG